MVELASKVAVAKRRAWCCTRVVATLLTASCFCSHAWAFKVETHIWIAQHIINDLSSGKDLSFQVGHNTVLAPVPTHVRDAILANQMAFRLGSIGPDAFPGIFEGQMTIHPGSEHKGWGSGDWLRHLVKNATNPTETAFAYGALTHAAGDIFAHTYVNQYAGDLYLLTDGEIDVERRHFLLEGYIAEKMPPLNDAQGVALPSLAELIGDAQSALPVDLLRRAYVDSSEASREWGRNGSNHFTAVHDLNRELSNLSKEGGPLEKMHLQAQKLLIAYNFGIQVSDDQLRKLNEAHQRIRDLSNDAIDKLQEFDKGFRNEAMKFIRAGSEAEQKALEEAQRLLGDLQRLHGQRARFEKDVADAADQLKKTLDPCENKTVDQCDFPQIKIPCLACGSVPFVGRVCTPAGCGATTRDLCKAVVDVSCATHARGLGLGDIVKAKNDLLSGALGEITQTLKKYKEAMALVHASAEQVLKAESALLHAGIDILQRFNSNVDPLRSLIDGWRADNDIAMNAYFKANGAAIRNAMVSANPLDPLKQWVSCELPKILGIPGEGVSAACVVKDTIAQIKTTLDKLEELATRDVPILREIRQLRTQIEDAVKVAARRELIEFGSRVTGVEIQRLLNLLTEKASASAVNAEFARTDLRKPLVVFDNVAARIDKEMHIDSSGKFNPTEFLVVRNATVLARLALLDAEGLNKIIGRQLYSNAEERSSNIIFAFASSIDGNHQWLGHSPPYPRRSKAALICGDQNGYPEGFPLWRDPKGKKLFADIFQGPLSPGLEIPKSLGLPPGLPSTYPYKPTARNPYPGWTSSMNKGTCQKRSS
ncbi:zinc dependent phospholipase C family protein [Variovorax sp. LjRoot130]